MSQAAEPIHRRALKNTFVGGLSFVISATMGFVSVPICLRAWGKDRYGVWLALLAGFMMLRTVDGGYVNYVGNQLNVLYHQDRDRMRRSLASSLWVCVGLSLLELLVWVWMMSTGTLNSILGVDADNIERHGLGPALGVLLAISTVSGPFLSIVHRLYIPVGMMYEAAWWSIGLQVTQAFAQICAALLGATIFEAALLFSFLQAAAFIGTALYLRHRVPELVPWWRDRDLKTGIYDFFRSLLLSVNGAGQQATTSGVVLLVSSMFGASFVPMFATVKTLSNVWTGLGTVFASPLLPEVVRFHGTKEHHKLFMAFRAHWFFSGLVVNGSMIVLLPFIPTFYAIWTHRELSFENALFLCSLASVSLINFGAVLNVYLSGINSLAAQLVTTSVRAVVIFALGAALIPRQGMAGLGVSLLVAEIVCSVGLAIYFSNRELARFEVRLPWTSIGLALLQTLPVQLLAMESLIAGRVRPMSCVVAAAGLTLVAWVSWKGLDPDVKTRILHVLRR